MMRGETPRNVQQKGCASYAFQSQVYVRVTPSRSTQLVLRFRRSYWQVAQVPIGSIVEFTFPLRSKPHEFFSGQPSDFSIRL